MELRSVNNLCLILQVNRKYLFDLRSRASSCYKSHDIPKKNSDEKRRIDSPNDELKSIQKKINTKILKPMVDVLPDYMHGSRTKKGIKTNAMPHVGRKMLLSLDIEKCFPNITCEKIYYTFRRNGCSKLVARILVDLTTKDGALPQGCPTSSSICNLVMAPLVTKMFNANNTKGINTSQYVDDLFFSGNKKAIKSIIRPTLASIWGFGLKHNSQKVRLQSNNNTMRVTGIIVNKKISVGRKRIRIIEREIMKITKKDVDEYHTILEKRRRQNKTKQRKHIESCKLEKIYGEVSSVISINRQQGLRLRHKLEKQIKSVEKSNKNDQTSQ